MNDKAKEITQDLANAIIRGDTMVPVCNVGPLLEYIDELEMSLVLEQQDKNHWKSYSKYLGKRKV